MVVEDKTRPRVLGGNGETMVLAPSIPRASTYSNQSSSSASSHHAQVLCAPCGGCMDGEQTQALPYTAHDQLWQPVGLTWAAEQEHQTEEIAGGTMEVGAWVALGKHPWILASSVVK